MKSHLSRRDFCKLTAVAAGVTILPAADVVAAAEEAVARGRARLHRALHDAGDLADGAAKKAA